MIYWHPDGGAVRHHRVPASCDRGASGGHRAGRQRRHGTGIFPGWAYPPVGHIAGEWRVGLHGGLRAHRSGRARCVDGGGVALFRSLSESAASWISLGTPRPARFLIAGDVGLPAGRGSARHRQPSRWRKVQHRCRAARSSPPWCLAGLDVVRGGEGIDRRSHIQLLKHGGRESLPCAGHASSDHVHGRLSAFTTPPTPIAIARPTVSEDSAAAHALEGEL